MTAFAPLRSLARALALLASVGLSPLAHSQPAAPLPAPGSQWTLVMEVEDGAGAPVAEPLKTLVFAASSEASERVFRASAPASRLELSHTAPMISGDRARLMASYKVSQMIGHETYTAGEGAQQQRLVLPVSRVTTPYLPPIPVSLPLDGARVVLGKNDNIAIYLSIHR